MIVHYHPTGETPEAVVPVATQGVSALLEGQAEALIPEGNPRHLRRPARPVLNGKKHGSNGNGNGHAPRELDS